VKDASVETPSHVGLAAAAAAAAAVIGTGGSKKVAADAATAAAEHAGSSICQACADDCAEGEVSHPDLERLYIGEASVTQEYEDKDKDLRELELELDTLSKALGESERDRVRQSIEIRSMRSEIASLGKDEKREMNIGLSAARDISKLEAELASTSSMLGISERKVLSQMSELTALNSALDELKMQDGNRGAVLKWIKHIMERVSQGPVRSSIQDWQMKMRASALNMKESRILELEENIGTGVIKELDTETAKQVLEMHELMGIMELERDQARSLLSASQQHGKPCSIVRPVFSLDLQARNRRPNPLTALSAMDAEAIVEGMIEDSLGQDVPYTAAVEVLSLWVEKLKEAVLPGVDLSAFQAAVDRVYVSSRGDAISTSISPPLHRASGPERQVSFSDEGSVSLADECEVLDDRVMNLEDTLADLREQRVIERSKLEDYDKKYPIIEKRARLAEQTAIEAERALRMVVRERVLDEEETKEGGGIDAILAILGAVIQEAVWLNETLSQAGRVEAAEGISLLLDEISRIHDFLSESLPHVWTHQPPPSTRFEQWVLDQEKKSKKDELALASDREKLEDTERKYCGALRKLHEVNRAMLEASDIGRPLRRNGGSIQRARIAEQLKSDFNRIAANLEVFALREALATNCDQYSYNCPEVCELQILLRETQDKTTVEAPPGMLSRDMWTGLLMSWGNAPLFDSSHLHNPLKVPRRKQRSNQSTPASFSDPPLGAWNKENEDDEETAEAGTMVDIRALISLIERDVPPEKRWAADFSGDFSHVSAGRARTPERRQAGSQLKSPNEKSPPPSSQIRTNKEPRSPTTGAPTLKRKLGWLMKKAGGKLSKPGGGGEVEAFKRSNFGRSHWTKRFFMLKGPTFSYFENEEYFRDANKANRVPAGLYMGDLTTAKTNKNGDLLCSVYKDHKDRYVLEVNFADRILRLMPGFETTHEEEKRTLLWWKDALTSHHNFYTKPLNLTAVELSLQKSLKVSQNAEETTLYIQSKLKRSAERNLCLTVKRLIRGDLGYRFELMRRNWERARKLLDPEPVMEYWKELTSEMNEQGADLEEARAQVKEQEEERLRLLDALSHVRVRSVAWIMRVMVRVSQGPIKVAISEWQNNIHKDQQMKTVMAWVKRVMLRVAQGPPRAALQDWQHNMRIWQEKWRAAELEGSKALSGNAVELAHGEKAAREAVILTLSEREAAANADKVVSQKLTEELQARLDKREREISGLEVELRAKEDRILLYAESSNDQKVLDLTQKLREVESESRKLQASLTLAQENLAKNSSVAPETLGLSDSVGKLEALREAGASKETQMEALKFELEAFMHSKVKTEEVQTAIERLDKELANHGAEFVKRWSAWLPLPSNEVHDAPKRMSRSRHWSEQRTQRLNKTFSEEGDVWRHNEDSSPVSRDTSLEFRLNQGLKALESRNEELETTRKELKIVENRMNQLQEQVRKGDEAVSLLSSLRQEADFLEIEFETLQNLIVEIGREYPMVSPDGTPKRGKFSDMSPYERTCCIAKLEEVAREKQDNSELKRLVLEVEAATLRLGSLSSQLKSAQSASHSERAVKLKRELGVAENAMEAAQNELDAATRLALSGLAAERYLGELKDEATEKKRKVSALEETLEEKEGEFRKSYKKTLPAFLEHLDEVPWHTPFENSGKEGVIEPDQLRRRRQWKTYRTMVQKHYDTPQETERHKEKREVTSLRNQIEEAFSDNANEDGDLSKSGLRRALVTLNMETFQLTEKQQELLFDPETDFVTLSFFREIVTTTLSPDNSMQQWRSREKGVLKALKANQKPLLASLAR